MRKRHTRTDDTQERLLSEQDLDLLARFLTHKWMPSNWVIHFDGRNYQDMQLRLRAFFDRKWLRRKYELAKDKHINYALDIEGYKLLKLRGRITEIPTLTNQDDAHEILGCITRMSFAIGAKEHNVTLFTSEEVIAHKNTPEATKALKDPHTIPLKGTYKTPRGDRIRTVIPDDVLLFATQNKVALTLHEWDRNTEPVQSFANRQAWNYKFEKYNEFYSLHRPFDHYAVADKSTFLCIITINEEHKRRILELAKKKFRYLDRLLLTGEPDHLFERSYPKPSGSMFTRQWTRGDGSTFSFDEHFT